MKPWDLLGGLGAGAGVIYLLDPQSGRRCVKALRGRAGLLAQGPSAALLRTSRDLADRVLSLTSRVARVLRPDPDTDDVVERRVRATLRRCSFNPGALTALAEAGCVTLSGPILADEAGPLISAVCRVRGVEKVIDQLEVHETSDGIPALQERSPLHPGPEGVHEWPAARFLASAAGGGLAAWGVVRRDWVGAAAGTVGVGLLARGLVGRDAGAALDDTYELVEVSRTITVTAPRERTFDLWARYENFPRFLSGVEAVTDLGDGRSHWIAAGPHGLPFGWDAEITLFVPGHAVSWRSSPRSAIRNAGTLHFDAVDGGTRVSVQMTYEPPAGALGRVAAALFDANPGGRLDQDLLAMKTFIETAGAPQDAAPLVHEKNDA